MGNWVTVSTKVRREILEKARRYGINVSEVLRKALEEEVMRRENEELIGLLKEASKELRKISEIYGDDFVVRSIRADRDSG
ncbi:type II toxin-antitoxin system CcdA family antitoxin [Vulcanisaeta sp. JCM 16159]|uniref:type II toxin-antitoxin system CcdA family antitoxin n=1 Tax=Vulcanisaeta sp. JCM 16159 TaxID=1295371 RepID=UPI0006D104AA|nr:type II toxin-antitoxin system CcdA family antitoxin [Vulcanisaeta sp. JCM 16159]